MRSSAGSASASRRFQLPTNHLVDMGASPRMACTGGAVVIGAGVSGCACAATLARCGVRVILVSAALDSVGQPAYGPVVSFGVDGWNKTREVFGALPRPLRDAWLDAGMGSVDGVPVVCVDRRKLSIETKRALECFPGLELRQGLVNAIEPDPGCDPGLGQAGLMPFHIRVASVFGESYGADVVVVAVGLSLDGQVSTGKAVSRGGRYGETASDGLYRSLVEHGAHFEPAEVTVGSCFLGSDLLRADVVTGLRKGWCGGDGKGGLATTKIRALRELLSESTAGPEDRPVWPDEYPCSPHWETSLKVDVVVTQEWEASRRLVLAPDGVATGEVYAPAGSRDAGTRLASRGPLWGEPGWRTASRLEHKVRGVSVVNLDTSGRLLGEAGAASAIWVSGRAGGAKSYLESLASGVRTARSVVRHMNAGGRGMRSRRPPRGGGRPAARVDSTGRFASERPGLLEPES